MTGDVTMWKINYCDEVSEFDLWVLDLMNETNKKHEKSSHVFEEIN